MSNNNTIMMNVFCAKKHTNLYSTFTRKSQNVFKRGQGNGFPNIYAYWAIKIEI